jgi:hypothetical protein
MYEEPSKKACQRTSKKRRGEDVGVGWRGTLPTTPYRCWWVLASDRILGFRYCHFFCLPIFLSLSRVCARGKNGWEIQKEDERMEVVRDRQRVQRRL